MLYDINIPDQVRSLLRFHVYFTIRRILYELQTAPPEDSAFNAVNNPYSQRKYENLCREFGLSPSLDYRFTYGGNEGLGTVYIAPKKGSSPIVEHTYTYPGTITYKYETVERYHSWLKPSQFADGTSYKIKKINKTLDLRFSDEKGEKGAKYGNLIDHIQNSYSAKQYEHFIISNASGLTSAGLVRLNESIEAFVYCVLGAQVDVRSSTLGDTGGAGEVKEQLVVKLEEIIKDTDISDNIVKFQNAIQASKVRLNFAVSPGTWLMPSKMVLNTQKITGYNNNLKKTTTQMKLGINEDLNSIQTSTKTKEISHMDDDKSKIHRLIPAHSKESAPVQNSARTPSTARQHEEIKIGTFAIIGILSFGLAWYLR